MEHRNQQDVSIWLSHIQFLKTNGWEEGVSRLYLRLLQVHNDKPSLWIEAAKWEFENEGSAENGRKILLRGLRFVLAEIKSDNLSTITILQVSSQVLGSSQGVHQAGVALCGTT